MVSDQNEFYIVDKLQKCVNTCSDDDDDGGNTDDDDGDDDDDDGEEEEGGKDEEGPYVEDGEGNHMPLGKFTFIRYNLS